MSATAPPASVSGPTVPVAAWGTARLLAGTGEGRLDLAHHRAVHGARRSATAESLARLLDEVRLLGRGGAAFPVAVKLRATAADGRAHVVVNGSEGEPASQKDRVLMTLAPHLVLDGALAVAAALAAQHVTVVVQDAAAHASFTLALRERTDARSVRLVRHHHGFVGGEVRAVLRALSGGPAVPPGRRVLPTEHGVDGRPTFASNVETFAQIALALSLGPQAFTSVGSATEPGTTLVTLVGGVRAPGVLEVPTGLPLEALVGSEPGALLIGGYHGTWVDEPAGLIVTRPDLKRAGAPLNAGVLARLPVDTCALGEVIQVASWLAGESAGQCGPCVLGLPRVTQELERLALGTATENDIRSRTTLVRGRGACAHPDGAVRFVDSALGVLAAEIAEHRVAGHCGRPLRGSLPLGAEGAVP